MIFSKIKTYSLVAVGAVMSVLLVVLKVVLSQNSKLRRKAEAQEARIKHTKKVMLADKEIEEQADVHLAEVTKEINDTGAPSELTNPNDGWVRDDGDNE